MDRDEPPFMMMEGAENPFFSFELPQAQRGFFLSPHRTRRSRTRPHALHSNS